MVILLSETIICGEYWISQEILYLGFDSNKQKVKDELERLRENFPSERFIYTQIERYKYFIVEEGELIIDRTGGGSWFFK